MQIPVNLQRLVPYPLLLTLAILIDRIVISTLEIDPWQSIRPLLLILASVILIMITIQLRVRDWSRAEFLTTVMLGLFLFYRSVYGYLKVRIPGSADTLALALIPILGGVFILISRRQVWESMSNPARLSSYFSGVFALLLLFQLVRLGGGARAMVVSQADPRSAVAPLPEDIRLRAESQPDIYIIVLDGYGRQDVLQQIYEYDNSEFLESLEQRGFYVADESHSNYIQTVYSIVSLLNFDYVQPWEPPASLLQYLLQPVRENRVFQMLDEIGYTTVSFESGTTYTQIDSAEVYLSSFLPLNRFESLLLVDSPIEPIANLFDLPLAIPGYPTHRARTLYDFDELGHIPASIAGPKIVYAHIIIPHPPFVFDADGNALDPVRPYNIWDGDEYQGTLEEYRDGYRNQVIFANSRIIEAIDNILAESETQPIILLMGDHGPGSMFKWDVESPGCLWERTSNLYALRLPGNQNSGLLHPSMTPVNTFRVVFNTYFGTSLPMLEDQTYFVSSQTGDQVADITQTRDLKTNCTTAK